MTRQLALIVVAVALSPRLCLAQAAAAIAAPAGRAVSAGLILQVQAAQAMPPQAAAAIAAAQAQAAAGATSAGPDPKQQRLAKIREQQFDRRPSTILKTWIEPAPTPPAPPKTETKPEATKPADAKPAEEAKPAEVAAKDKPAEETAEAKPAAEEPAGEAAPTEPKSETAEATAAKAAAEKAAAEAKAAAEKAAAEAARQAQLMAEFDYQLKLFGRQVTLGQWAEAKTYLAQLDKEKAKELYARLLESLRAGPQGAAQNFNPQLLQQMLFNAADPTMLQAALSAGGQGPGAALLERNEIAMNDLLGLMRAAPAKLEEENLQRLGTLLRQATSAGHDLQELLAALKPVGEAAESEVLSRRQIALLLQMSGESARTGDYLPSLEDAIRDQDFEGLNLLAEHYLAMHRKEEKTERLEQAWKATQAVLAIPLPKEAQQQQVEPSEPTAEEEGQVEVFELENLFDVGCDETPATVTVTVEAQPTTTPAASAEQTKAAEEAKQKAEAEEAKKKALAARKKAHQDALRRAVELAPRLRKELGQQWLDESFAAQVDRGQEILSAIGTSASTNPASRPTQADSRLKTLQLQSTAVEALLRAAPERARQWSDVLTVLAGSWLREAQSSYQLDQRSQMGPNWGRDRFGNFYYMDDETGVQNMMYNQGQVQPIKCEDLLDTRPSAAWLALVSSDLKPRFAEICAQLYLKAGDEGMAFPFVEELATTHPDQARKLAEEFIRVWTKNHNPNQSRTRNDPFMYYFGFERRADRIPLTRSKQQRNLTELSEWVRRLRALPIGELNEQLLTRAFTTSHSTAEVYRLEAIENVFGSMEELKPKTLAELVQQMRGNLASVWQMPDVQKQNSTNRKQRDIQLEVLRGFEVARAVVQKGLAKRPDEWSLVLADATLLHDENDFRQQLEKSSEYSGRRQAALEQFRRAAELYVKAVDSIPTEQQSPQVFEQWFYAGLGAVDLERITADRVADVKQPALIREAMLSLPGEAAERHMAQFANNLFTRTSNAKPELKFRYLRSGFEIVGDHKLAREARKLLDYYDDLVTEIKLETRIDGSDQVGHERPFGVFVNLVHTKEIERESGGFGRYLQNQQNSNLYYYNYGRPLENYRDKFSDMARQALGDQFEVISVTFQEPEVHSRALPEYGWRVTPYAYLLLKAKGPEVDKIAPLRLDLDFLDTSGYALLPVESPIVPLDARGEKLPARPASNLVVTQTLDERQAAEGKLVLEVRATAHGLVPELDELVELKSPGFEVVETDDTGVAVTRFEKESAESTIGSERTWTLTLRATELGEGRPKEFHFATARQPLQEVVLQRYEDADLVKAEPVASLEKRYGRAGRTWIWFAALGLPLGVLVVFALVRLLQRPRVSQAARFALPDQVTPFTVLGLLREIQAHNGLPTPSREELAASISRLERHYFFTPEPAEPDLAEIAERWVRQSSMA